MKQPVWTYSTCVSGRVINPARMLLDTSLLFKVNHLLFHPLGYSLVLHIPDGAPAVHPGLRTDTTFCASIKDYRKVDPEGSVFDETQLKHKQAIFDTLAAVRSEVSKERSRCLSSDSPIQGLNLTNIAKEMHETYERKMHPAAETAAWEELTATAQDAWLTLAAMCDWTQKYTSGTAPEHPKCVSVPYPFCG